MKRGGNRKCEFKVQTVVARRNAATHASQGWSAAEPLEMVHPKSFSPQRGDTNSRHRVRHGFLCRRVAAKRNSLIERVQGFSSSTKSHYGPTINKRTSWDMVLDSTPG